MKLLFSSTHIEEVEFIGNKLGKARIPYRVRYDPAPERPQPGLAYAELWIQNDADAPRAMLLYLRQSPAAPALAPKSWRAELPGELELHH